MRFPTLAPLALFGASILSSGSAEGSNLANTPERDPVAEISGKNACDQRGRFGVIFGGCVSTEERTGLNDYLTMKEGGKDGAKQELKREEEERKKQEEAQIAYAEAFISNNQKDPCRDFLKNDPQAADKFVAFVNYALKQGVGTDVYERLLPQVIASIGIETYRSTFLEAIMKRLSQDYQQEMREAVQAAITQTCGQNTAEAS